VMKEERGGLCLLKTGSISSVVCLLMRRGCMFRRKGAVIKIQAGRQTMMAIGNADDKIRGQRRLPGTVARAYLRKAAADSATRPGFLQA